jgi:hypothetical protein
MVAKDRQFNQGSNHPQIRRQWVVPASCLGLAGEETMNCRPSVA